MQLLLHYFTIITLIEVIFLTYLCTLFYRLLHVNLRNLYMKITILKNQHIYLYMLAVGLERTLLKDFGRNELSLRSFSISHFRCLLYKRHCHTE